MSTKPRTLFEKIWDEHVVYDEPDRQTILYIDLHLVHEVTSPQAFESLRLSGRKVRRPELTLSTVDHNVPTTDRSLPILDPISKQQIDTLRNNCREFGITLYDIHDPRQGIVHVIGPEQGYTQPGMTIVCGDSHTSTHGAFGALAFGIGTSEVEHVLATQTLLQSKAKTLELRVDGRLGPGVTAKDVILYLIGQITTSGGTGYCVEYTGEVVRSFSMENRMTVCNMSIEGGARAGLIAPDETTYDYLRGRPHAPQGAEFDKAVARWRKLPTDAGAKYDKSLVFDGTKIAPQVTWGTNPGQVAAVNDRVPKPAEFSDPNEQKAAASALEYMGLSGGEADLRFETRPRVHRLVYQRPHRRPAGRRRCGQRPQSGQPRGRDGRPRQRTREAASGKRGPRPHLQRGRLRVARGRLQHVPGDEPRQARAWRTLRIDLQPQLRRPPRQRRPHAPRLPRHGRRRRVRGAFCRHP